MWLPPYLFLAHPSAGVTFFRAKCAPTISKHLRNEEHNEGWSATQSFQWLKIECLKPNLSIALWHFATPCSGKVKWFYNISEERMRLCSLCPFSYTVAYPLPCIQVCMGWSALLSKSWSESRVLNLSDSTQNSWGVVAWLKTSRKFWVEKGHQNIQK